MQSCTGRLELKGSGLGQLKSMLNGENYIGPMQVVLVYIVGQKKTGSV